MEPLIHHAFANKVLEQAGLDTRRQWRVQYALYRNESLFQADCIPDRSPERDALLDISLMHVVRANLEQSVHGPLEFVQCDPKGLADSNRRRCGNICASLDEV